MWRDKSKKDINIIRTFMIVDDDNNEDDSNRNNDAMMMLMITRVSSKR